jgi:PKD repeat protein
MGSIAINNDHKIAIGYSISSSSMSPNIRYVGQSSSANASATGTFDIAESANMVTSPQSQGSSHRWGDYALMSIDPNDETTFWFTNEYYNSGKKTRIFSFTLGAPVLTAVFSGSPTNVQTGNTVTYTDASHGPNPITSWSWSFPGGTPSTATGAGPHVITYNTLGVYDASLTVGDGSTNDTENKTNYINVTNCTVASYPYSEGFENGGNIPNCWSNEYVTDTQDWAYQAGGQGGNPGGAHSGSYNAYLYNASTTANVTRLVSPQFDLSGMSSATLTFWHTQAYWNPDQDELRVYYKTSSGGTWTLMATYTNDISAWTQETINLSSLTGDYYIAFEGTAQYGHGVCIDDVGVDGVISGPTNNTCASATSIAEVTDLAFDTGSGATASGVNPGCGGGTDPVDLWYAYTATVTADATIDLCGSTFDTRLAVYDACGGTLLACNDDACGYQSRVEITVTSGTIYYIQVGGYNASTGTGDLTIELSNQWAGGT